MNYYPMHVGDYAAHTAHLEPMEDLAYRRMLDWYYLNEKALPADPVKVARLVRMPQCLPVIQAVLDEFFVPSDDGWHNKRADAELTSMLAKQEQQSSKDAHEAERMRRYRERRAELFAALRAVGVVPAWDIAMKELQRLHDENCNAPATHLQREQVVTCNAPATAIPTPTPTPIVNTPIPPAKPGATPAKTAAVSLPTWLTTIKAMGEQPMPETDPVFDYAEQAGIPMDMMRLCWVEFRNRYSEPGAKRYRDWRSVYRKAVRGNWFRLWRAMDGGGYALTTEGQQAQRALDAKAGVAA